MSENPFQMQGYDDQADWHLVNQSLNGSKKALETLINRHYNFIYNVVWKMMLNPQDAEDLTQDILVKVITKLSAFGNRSLFRTWLYRIVVNHVLNCKKQKRELLFTDFHTAAGIMDQLPDNGFPGEEDLQFASIAEDVKISCTAGMLLCLDRGQRITFILGAVFQIDHNLGAEILEVSPVNFRQRLSRARKDLYSFMNNKCGLVNKSNPCRCPKKTKAFIALGWAMPDNLQFNARHIKSIYEAIPQKNNDLLSVLEEKYENIFSAHPLQESLTAGKIVDGILNDNRVKSIFNLD